MNYFVEFLLIRKVLELSETMELPFKILASRLAKSSENREA